MKRVKYLEQYFNTEMDFLKLTVRKGESRLFIIIVNVLLIILLNF